MNLRKLVRIAGDLIRTNIAFVRSGSARARIREGLKIDSFAPHLNAIVLAEANAAPAPARPYARLAENSLALTAITKVDSRPRALNLVVGEVRVGGVFAGIHTAITTAVQLADLLGVVVRIVMLDPTSTDNSREKVERFVRHEFKREDVQVVTRDRIRRTTFGSRDYWLATHSKTAHALQVACETGVIDPATVAYLIQDYEPGFSPWSTESVLAESTYHAGFVPIVNSKPLWEYLTGAIGLDIPGELVFSPHSNWTDSVQPRGRGRPTTRCACCITDGDRNIAICSPSGSRPSRRLSSPSPTRPRGSSSSQPARSTTTSTSATG